MVGNDKEFLWVEKYRPHKIEDCILPERILTRFKAYVANNEIPNLLLTGTAGVGKTTIARAVCEEAGVDYLFINASRQRGIDTFRTQISNYASAMSLRGRKKVVILDEGDGLTPEAQQAFRGCIEEFSRNCTFIITGNYRGKLLEPILSRMSEVSFQLRGDEKAKMASAFCTRLGEILDTEGVKYDRKVLVEIVRKYFPDFRKTLGELQSLAKDYGNIDSAALGAVNDVRNVSELVGYLKAKDFGNMRKWVVEHGDLDPSRLYRKIYDALYSYLEPSSIPQAVLIIAKYQYQSVFVADQEISMVACLTELMVDCTYK